MVTSRPLVLISNDDSINAPGILRLVDCIPEGVDIIVAAPAAPQSGQSSALTVGAPLRISQRPDYRQARMFAINGTPVDCVKLALNAIVPRRPDLVLAGINHGSNSGCNVIYSGTMGAVLEGCVQGITSCGFSLLNHAMDADFTPSMPFIKEVVAQLLATPLPDGICLNINIPARTTPKGLKVCRAAKGYWTDEYARYTDPQGAPFFLLQGRFVNSEPQATDTDEHWLAQGYIAAVPVLVDNTATAPIQQLAQQYNR